MAETVVTVDLDSAGSRLDLFLARRFNADGRSDGFSRAELQRLIKEGQVTINHHLAKASARLKPRDTVRLRTSPPRPSALIAEKIPLDVLFEDEHVIVVNKAAGLMVHPATGKTTGTLVNALLYHCPDLSGIGGERRPGIVHRLDKDTSGVLAIAKTVPAFQRLAHQFKERQVKKEYVALVWGKLPRSSGVIDRPIGRHRSDRKRMSSRYSLVKKREAFTEWKVEKLFEIHNSPGSSLRVSLLRLKPKTGRTHQLRVHLADMGYPIVGDKTYGHKRKPRTQNSDRQAMLESFPRQALHAATLSFHHPVSESLVTFCAPLPPDMRALLSYLDDEIRVA